MDITFAPDGTTAGTIHFTCDLGKFIYRWEGGMVFQRFVERPQQLIAVSVSTREQAVEIARENLVRLLHRSHREALRETYFRTQVGS